MTATDFGLSLLVAVLAFALAMAIDAYVSEGLKRKHAEEERDAHRAREKWLLDRCAELEDQNLKLTGSGWSHAQPGVES